MTKQQAKYAIGQLIRHRMFHYRGVIIDVDPVFMGDDAWYELQARSRPPKDRPWYHVLVDQTDTQTYVAERNLEVDRSTEPIRHPLVDQIFSSFHNGRYPPLRKPS